MKERKKDELFPTSDLEIALAIIFIVAMYVAMYVAAILHYLGYNF